MEREKMAGLEAIKYRQVQRMKDRERRPTRAKRAHTAASDVEFLLTILDPDWRNPALSVKGLREVLEEARRA